MSTESEQRVLREVVLEQLTTGEIRAYRMWLPPLTEPTPVNELVGRDHHQPLPANHAADASSAGR